MAEIARIGRRNAKSATLRRRLEFIDLRIADLKKRRTNMIQEAQEACDHPSDEIIEAPEKKLYYFDCLKPFRVCRLCGYAEEEWGCGYKKLNKNVHLVLQCRESALPYVLTMVRQNDPPLRAEEFKERRH